jgi:hypothetical protein
VIRIIREVGFLADLFAKILDWRPETLARVVVVAVTSGGITPCMSHRAVARAAALIAA